MKLAINYSPPAAQLVKSGKIEIDHFKTPNWRWMVDEALELSPVAVHFDLEAGNGRLQKEDWDEIEQLAEKTNTPFINIHIDPKQKYHPDLDLDTKKKKDTEHIFKAVYSDVMILVKRFGSDKVIAENSPYRGEVGKTIHYGVMPELITRVIQETGCGLLLDISHAIISSRTLGIDPVDYFQGLPVQKTKELHFAGIHMLNGDWVDHLPITKDDWPWLDWAFENIAAGQWSTPWQLAFEYGGVGKEFAWRSEQKVILSQVPELMAKVKALNPRVSLMK